MLSQPAGLAQAGFFYGTGQPRRKAWSNFIFIVTRRTGELLIRLPVLYSREKNWQ